MRDTRPVEVIVKQNQEIRDARVALGLSSKCHEWREPKEPGHRYSHDRGPQYYLNHVLFMNRFFTLLFLDGAYPNGVYQLLWVDKNGPHLKENDARKSVWRSMDDSGLGVIHEILMDYTRVDIWPVYPDVAREPRRDPVDPHNWEVIHNEENPKAWWGRACGAYDQGYPFRAQNGFEEFLFHCDREPKAAFNLGRIAEQQNRIEEAGVWYRCALSIQPNYPRATDALAALKKLWVAPVISIRRQEPQPLNTGLSMMDVLRICGAPKEYLTRGHTAFLSKEAVKRMGDNTQGLTRDSTNISDMYRYDGQALNIAENIVLGWLQWKRAGLMGVPAVR